MQNKFLLLLILIVGCGKQVSISTTKLKNASESNALSVMKEGTLVRGNPDRIMQNGNPLTVSKYSSHLSLQFIKTIPMGQEISVKFEGDVKGTEVILRTLENK